MSQDFVRFVVQQHILLYTITVIYASRGRTAMKTSNCSSPPRSPSGLHAKFFVNADNDSDRQFTGSTRTPFLSRCFVCHTQLFHTGACVTGTRAPMPGCTRAKALRTRASSARDGDVPECSSSRGCSKWPPSCVLVKRVVLEDELNRFQLGERG